MPSSFYLPHAKLFDTGNSPLSGAKAFFYITATSTPKNTYSDFALTTPNANPVIADSAGVFPQIFLADDARYRVTLQTSAGATIYTQDDVGVTVTTTFGTTLTITAGGLVVLAGGAAITGNTSVSGGTFTTRGVTDNATATRVTLADAGAAFSIGAPPANVAGLSVAGSAYTPEVSVTFSATAMTVDCSRSNVFRTTFTANVTVAPTISNAVDGQTINWFITQDATGSRTMTWPTSFKWPAAAAGVLSTGANAVDLLVGTFRSTTGFWYVTLTKAFG